MRYQQLAENVVLYIEKSKEEKLGTFQRFTNNDNAYINEDALEVVLHILRGGTIESFFLINLTEELRKKRVNQAQAVLSKLKEQNFLIESDRLASSSRIKHVLTEPPLRVLFIETTKSCNLYCKHCYVPDCGIKSNQKQFSFLGLQHLISQADELGIMEIQLTGGEFFSQPWAAEIIQDLQRRLLPCSIFTNGTLLPEKFFESLKNMPHGVIFYISLYGSEEIHDEFCRVQGAYKKTVKTIERLLGLGCDVRINTTVGSYNIIHMNAFMKLVRERFGVLHRLVKIERLGRAEKDKELLISDKEFAELLSGHKGEIQFLDSHGSSSYRDWTTPACGIGNAMMFVDAYGNSSLCPTLTQEQNSDFIAGNIYKKSIKEIWEKSDVFNRFRIIQCRKIKKCRFREICSGGCRSRAYLSTGDINAPDEAMCYLYGKKF